MRTKELFLKDPLGWKLVNEGVSSNNTEDLATLRFELDSFVCDGEYLSGMRRILQGYRDGFKGPEQKAAWISGFYGSGKSHLAKVLRYLWVNFKFPDGATARSLAHLPSEITDLLTEISTLGKRHDGLHMAGGTLKAGAGSVRLRVMGLVFKSVGLPEGYPYAKLLIHLKRDGKLDAFKKAIEDQGKDFEQELRRLYGSGAVAKAYVKCHDHLKDPSQVGAMLRADYPNVADVSIDEMCTTIREAIAGQGHGGRLPCTLLVLDEIQQFIGQDAQAALDVQEVTEALSKEMDGRLMVVGTGQSALNDMPNLQRLLGRFTIKIHLKDNDVEKVVRTVVLQKRDDKKADIKQLIAKNEGEITRQLKATKLATQSDDDLAYLPDYPLLPVRRRFWERVLHSVDSTGTAAQMRTQLRVVHEACRAYADAELGAVVPGDFLYDQIANDLVTTGEMQKRFQEIIEQQKSQPDGALRSRTCALVFLINKLPREHGTDQGVRAEPEHLADLLSEDLVTGSTQLRQQLPGLLSTMEQDGVLMKVDSEYRLQTTEGAAWESEFRKRRAVALNDSPRIAAQLTLSIDKALASALGNPSVLHGDAKERRKVALHHGETKPEPTDAIPLWVRDGFAAPEASVLADIRKLSTDDATLHVFLPKAHADEIKNAIASAQAAEETLHFKGNPTSQEGRECRQAMVTKHNTEGQRSDELVGQILAGARLFLSGGQEQTFTGLKEGVEEAAKQVLNRLYPRFHEGDSAKWPAVLKKAKEGSASALGQVGFAGDPQTHPVAVAILGFLGAGKTGLEVRKKFNASPFGWPQDAVDAVLTTLLASNHLSAHISGKQLLLAEVDLKKLGQATFRAESPVLTAVQKLAIRKLFQESGLSKATPGNESADAVRFVEHAKLLAAQSGGAAPAPSPPTTPELVALEALSGNELLMGLYDGREALLAKIKEWQSVGKEIANRLPAFGLTEKLVTQTASVAELAADHAGWSATLISIRANRSLLDDPDPVSHVQKEAGNALRAALERAHRTYAERYASQLARIEAHGAWQKLTEKQRREMLERAGARERTAPEVGSDEQLLMALQSCSLPNWQSQTDALSAQFDKALAAAIIEAEPKARRVFLAPATIRDQAELDAWLQQSRTTIESALQTGPVILQ